MPENRNSHIELLGLGAVIFASFLIFLPVLRSRYFFDDFEHLALIAQQDGFGMWLFVPHNEHTVPLMRLLYYLCFNGWGADPAPFAAAVLIVFLANVALLYSVSRDFLEHFLSRFSAAALFGFSLVYSEALYWPGASHVTFSLFWMLLMIKAQTHFCRSRKTGWAFASGAAAFCCASCFSIGILSLPFALLFQFLFLKNPESGWKEELKNVTGPAVGWAMFVIIFLTFSGDASGTTLERLDISGGLLFSFQALLLLCRDQLHLPGLWLPVLVVLAISVAVGYAGKPKVRRLLVFIAAWIVASFLIVFPFRTWLGESALESGRYYLYPAAGLAWLIGVAVDLLWQRVSRSEEGKLILQRVVSVVAVAVLLLFAGAGYSASREASTRFENLTRPAHEISQQLSTLLPDYRDWLRKTDPSAKVRLPDRIVLKVDLPRPIGFYAGFLVPKDFYNEMEWFPAFVPFPNFFTRFLEERGAKAVMDWTRFIQPNTIFPPDPPLPGSPTSPAFALKVFPNVKAMLAQEATRDSENSIVLDWTDEGVLRSLTSTEWKKVHWLSCQIKSAAGEKGTLRFYFDNERPSGRLEFEVKSDGRFYRYDFELWVILGNDLEHLVRADLSLSDQTGRLELKDLRLLDAGGKPISFEH